MWLKQLVFIPESQENKIGNNEKNWEIRNNEFIIGLYKAHDDDIENVNEAFGNECTYSLLDG